MSETRSPAFGAIPDATTIHIGWLCQEWNCDKRTLKKYLDQIGVQPVQLWAGMEFITGHQLRQAIERTAMLRMASGPDVNE